MEHNTDTLASLPAIIAKPSYAQVASSPAAVSSFTISPPPSEKVLLVRPLEPSAGSSTTRNKITSFLLSKNLPFRITRIKNINNGGIAICLTTDEDDSGFEVNFSIKSKSSNNWVISVIPDLYPVIKDHGYLYLNFERVRIETFISVMQCSTCGTLGHSTSSRWCGVGIIAPILKPSCSCVCASVVVPRTTMIEPLANLDA
ncbi:hypothetical protein TNCV_1773531 [Trichonephila clavipes]|nr:hypothetical protein TNCV_1773531 [Trichonephila clavipes]